MARSVCVIHKEGLCPSSKIINRLMMMIMVSFTKQLMQILLQVMYMYYLLGHRLMELPISVDRKEVMAENTYLLTLDGDIDFQPPAVRLLIDLMKKNKNLGAACGRIHPVGSGNIFFTFLKLVV
jgi:hypothetical protein